MICYVDCNADRMPAVEACRAEPAADGRSQSDLKSKDGIRAYP